MKERLDCKGSLMENVNWNRREVVAVAFTKDDLSILGEIGNISVGGAASSLSDFIDRFVTITCPESEFVSFAELKKRFGSGLVVTKVNFAEGFNSSNFMLMEQEKALEFVQIIAREKVGALISDWDEFAQEVMAEVFNIMTGHMSTSLSDLFRNNVTINTPQVYQASIDTWDAFYDDDMLVAIWFDVGIEQEFSFQIIKLIEPKQAKQMVDILKGEMGEWVSE
ncbi:chemotaxis protein CheC [Bacillus luti]